MDLLPGPFPTDELAGDRILVAEDELLIALDVGSILSDAGAEIIGPATTLTAAIELARTAPLSAATLDVRLGRETTEAIAATLCDRGIPFLFYTGQVLPDHMRERWPEAPVVSKPSCANAIVAALLSLRRA